MARCHARVWLGAILLVAGCDAGRTVAADTGDDGGDQSDGGDASEDGSESGSSGGSGTGEDESDSGIGTDTGGLPPEGDYFAGFRASSYGINPFPEPGYWSTVAHEMADRLPPSQPGGVWILGTIANDGTCVLNFDHEGSFPDIEFGDGDPNEPVLDLFDETGVFVYLQVEPGDADVLTLIDIIMPKYAHHPSVIGFGVDVEWYRTSNENPVGVPVTDAEAADWVAAVRAMDPDDTVMVKHWLTEMMPETVRDGLFFLDDSQDFPTGNAMIAEFILWGRRFEPAPVGFQVGYASDRPWWGGLEDPAAAIGIPLLEEIPNTRGVFWVDFTVKSVFP